MFDDRKPCKSRLCAWAKLTGKWKGHFPKSDGLISILAIASRPRRKLDSRLSLAVLPACFLPSSTTEYCMLRRLPNPLLGTFIAPSCRQKERAEWRDVACTAIRPQINPSRKKPCLFVPLEWANSTTVRSLMFK